MKHLSKLAVLIGAMTMLHSASACPNDTPECRIDKKAWAELMTTALPAAFCKADSVFMQCYEMTQAQCLEATLPAAQQCIDETALPDSWTKGDGRKWGAVIGSCTEDKLVKVVKLKNGKTSDCTIVKQQP